MWSDPEMKRLMREVRSILKDIPKRDPQDKKFERQAFVTKTDFYNRMSTLKDKDPKKAYHHKKEYENLTHDLFLALDNLYGRCGHWPLGGLENYEKVVKCPRCGEISYPAKR